MPVAQSLSPLFTGMALVFALASASPAQTVRTETVAAESAISGTVIRGELTGEDTIDYVIAAEAGQSLSVDLSASNPSFYFNILPQGSDAALFIGSTSGNVADVSLPATGNYVVRVYLMRNAARRDELSDFALGIGLAGADFADGLAGGPDWWAVSGISAGALNIRSGPDTRYPVVGKAQNGEVMQNRGCRMTGAARWCSVRVNGSGVQGWAAGTYLVEAAAPAASDAPEGGPVGNGTPFDATGVVSCTATPAEEMRSCPFGVVRDGPGNAGVWIALDGGQERQILFEGGVPVSANADLPLSFDKIGDQFTIRIGDESYEFPEALVNGG
jgi:Bacterial SH3 domain